VSDLLRDRINKAVNSHAYKDELIDLQRLHIDTLERELASARRVIEAARDACDHAIWVHGDTYVMGLEKTAREKLRAALAEYDLPAAGREP
jgi:hypothetical protein